MASRRKSHWVAYRLLWVVLLLFISSSVGFGQINKSTLSGVVLDPTGAVIPGAEVKLVETSTQARFETKTEESGIYGFSALDLGEYTLTVTHPSFKTYIQSGLRMFAGDNKRLDVSLALGATTELVQVTGAPPLLDAESPTYTNTVATETLAKLPLQLASVKRDASQYISTIPGYQSGAGFSNNINGSIGTYSELHVDGAPAEGNPAAHGMFRAGFSSEALAEFKMADTPTADQGPTGGIVLSFVTKSGTNDFHGSVYEYLRNDALDSRSFFASEVTKNVQNEFGFTVGGPVMLPAFYDGKDKTFFFFNYGESRYRFGGAPAFYNMPIDPFKAGDFSRVLGPVIGTDLLGREVRENQIYDPDSTRNVVAGQVDSVSGLIATGTGIIRDPFVGNAIPTGRFSQVSQNFQSFYPSIPASAPLESNHFTAGGAGSTDERYLSLKIDHYHGKNHFAGLYWFSSYSTQYPHTLPSIFAIRTLESVRGNKGRWNWTRTHTNRLVSDFVFGIDREYVPLASTGDAEIGASLIGQPNALGRCTPQVNIAGFFSTTQAELKCGQKEGDTNWRFVENVSYARGKHMVKFGGHYYKWNANFPVENNAQFTFLAAQTGLPGALLDRTGYAYSSFLLGAVNNSDAKGQELQTPRIHAYGFYLQDRWRATPKLTLDLGLRWDIQPFPIHRHDTISQFDANLPNPGAGGRMGALTFAGVGPGRIGRRRLADTRYRDFGPRIGLAYEVNPETVVRANWGLYFGPVNLSMAGFGAVVQQGFFPLFSQASQDGFSAPFNWDGGFPFPPGINPEEPNLRPEIANGSNTAFFGPDSGRAPRIQMVHFGIQRRLAGDILVEASFLGKYARGILTASAESINQLDFNKYRSLGDLLNRQFDPTDPDQIAAGIQEPFPGFSGSVAQALRPFPQYLNIFNEGSAVTNSNWNAFQLKLQKRFTRGLTFLVGYTIGKELTDLGGGGDPGFFSATPQDAYNRRAEKSVSDVDIPQNLILHYVYELPFGPGKKFADSDNFFTRHVIGGWSVAGYHRYQSGRPISVTTDRILPTMGGFVAPSTLRPDRVEDVPIRTDASCGSFDPGSDLYLNRDAFAIPAPFQFGNVSRSLPNVRRCAQLDENVSVYKRFPIRGESVYFEFGADFFNLFNRHIWGPPVANIDNAAFGRILSTGPGRRIQFHGRMGW